MIHLDTSYLVDLLRETSRSERGPASIYLDSTLKEELAVSVFVACELFAGAELSTRASRERQSVDQIVAALSVDYPDERFPVQYARLLASLERTGQRVSAMDLLIATSAVVANAPLLTRNRKDFSRIAGLDVLDY